MLFILVLYSHINIRHASYQTVYFEGNSMDVFIVGLPPTANQSRVGVNY